MDCQSTVWRARGQPYIKHPADLTEITSMPLPWAKQRSWVWWDVVRTHTRKRKAPCTAHVRQLTAQRLWTNNKPTPNP
jgi:hypothetical protein